MFELADRLVGIYKTENATKSVTINPKLVAARAAGLKPVRELHSPPSVPLGDRTNTQNSK
jgi:structural maintenance of chromosome 4